MNTVIQRIFGTQQTAKADKSPNRMPIEQLRTSLQAVLHDCTDMRTQRVIYKINLARTAGDLWLLRSDLHQCVSQTHNQSEAAQRINSLIPAFEGWLPSGQLIRI